MILKRIDPFSAGKLLGVLYGILGLVVGGIFTLASLLGAAVAGANGAEGAIALAMGAGAIVIAPIMYGILGFIGGLIGAALFNLAAYFAGGLELEVDLAMRPGHEHIEP